MTPKEFADEMLRIVSADDQWTAHAESDDLMARALDELGYRDGVEIYRNAEKYYA